MSTLTQFLGGGVKSIQTGYIFMDTGFSTGSGENTRFVDVTVSSVNTSRTQVFVTGGFLHYSNDTRVAFAKDGLTMEISARMTSATNLRLSTVATVTRLTCRWTVVEYY